MGGFHSSSPLAIYEGARGDSFSNALDILFHPGIIEKVPPTSPHPEIPGMPAVSRFSRRDFLKVSLGGVGMSLPTFLQATARADRRTSSKSCIVLYCWGGMSHHETWDTKPDAPSEYRGEFTPIATAVPGIRVGEHLPRMARLTDKLAIVRSMHHRSSAHGKGMYWNITGHPPLAPEVAANQPPSRADWPCLGGHGGALSPSARGISQCRAGALSPGG